METLLNSYWNSKNDESGRVVDLLSYKNPYALSKKFVAFLGNHFKIFICRRCLNSFTGENMLMIFKRKCENYRITTFGTSTEPNLHCKDHVHKNPLYFRNFADFEADNEIDTSSIGNKTNKIYEQNAVLTGYHIISELDDILRSVYYESPLGYDNVACSVNEVIKLEKNCFLL